MSDQQLSIKDGDTGKVFQASAKAWKSSYANTMSKTNRKKKRFTIVKGEAPAPATEEGKKKSPASSAKGGGEGKAAKASTEQPKGGADGKVPESGKDGGSTSAESPKQ